MRKIAKIGLCTLIYLVVFDLIGVAACFFFDLVGVLPMKAGATSTLLFYTVWIVNGIFCGLLSYDAGGKIGSLEGPGDWTSREGAGRTGLLVAGIESVLVAGLLALCYRFLWQQGSAPDFYVPDNAGVTVAFFAAIVISVVFGHTQLRPSPEK